MVHPAAAPTKRLNKNRPQQLSSKRAVPTLRVAPGLSASAPSERVRDPRFDAVSAGSCDRHSWEQAYSFVFEQRREELSQMKRKLSESKAANKRKVHGGGEHRKRLRAKRLDADEESELAAEISKRSGQVRAQERAAKAQRVSATARKAEVRAVKEGKQPFYEKKSKIQARGRVRCDSDECLSRAARALTRGLTRGLACAGASAGGAVQRPQEVGPARQVPREEAKEGRREAAQEAAGQGRRLIL